MACVNLYNITQQQELADKLVELTFADTVFSPIREPKAASWPSKWRKYWYDKGAPERVEIIAFEGSFHGRSSAGIAAAGAEKLVKGFGPLLPGFKQLGWGDHEALEAAIDDTTAAIILEPVQGEGGIRPLPDACLMGVRELCDKHGILLILDEVQCGVGRTGKLLPEDRDYA